MIGTSGIVIAGIVVLGLGVVAYMLIKSQTDNNLIDAAAAIL
jgi:hypothetical protein